MKIGTKLQFEVPDSCPFNCVYRHERESFSMTSECFRCPVLNCGGDAQTRAIEPNHYRDDWAKSWEKFFKGL
jgi:hypothetical protein